ncbi:MAG: S26 family signal peptidase, partial [Synergistaceae bacterium]|nr:S26 family signal peptidase [Synergistaceae bacterium]
SLPLGLWLKADGEIKRGDVVQVPFDAFEFTEWVPEIYRKGNSWGDVPYLKRVAGLPGDLIEISDEGLEIAAGKIISHSAVLSADGRGNKLEIFPLPVILASDEVWLTSDVDRGFDSRYLGPAKLSECHKLTPLLTKP